MKKALTKPFAILLSGVYLENVAMMITWFATISLVMKISDNPLHVGMITMLETASLMLCSAFAGVMADRFDRKKIIVCSFLGMGVVTSALFFADSLWKIYTLAMVNGILFALYLPAKRALQPTLVNKEHYVDANSFDAMLRNILLIARPPGAAFVVSFFGANQAFLLAGVCTFAAAMIILALPVTKQARMERESDESVGELSTTKPKNSGLHELVEGIRTIRQDASLSYLVIVSVLVTFVFAMQGTLTFIHVEENLSQYGQTETIVGFLFSAVGAGGLVGAFLMRTALKYIQMIPLFLITLFLDGLLVIVFAFSTNLMLDLVLWVIFGVTATMNTIITDTIIQQTVETDMRGRVYGLLSTVNEPVSLLSTGVGTSMAGIIGAKFVFASVGLLETVVAIIGRCLPSYKQMNQPTIQSKQQAPQLQQPSTE
ncbi:MFS transporter [Brevibacillus sp. SYSU BS000544]|uniref:MFS transporter n=1 Tax=Brevibacillus sp. SYSU BS000544 TaxID=3416443 RepID=UPI003CE599D9